MRKILLIVLLVLALPIMAFADPPPPPPPPGSTAESAAIAVIQTGPGYLGPQPIYPYLLQLIPGVIGDATKEMALFDAVQILTNEKVVKVVTFNGWCWNRIRLEDVEKEIIEKLPLAMKKLGVDSTDRIRFRIKYKMSSRTIGSGGGGAGSVAGFGGGANPLAYGSNASVMPAVAVNTADPQFSISYYLTVPK
jgi:hypothetical protein